MVNVYDCILLVDDDETSNYISQRIVSKFFTTKQTRLVPNGQRAIEFIENYCEEHGKGPELIFLDINMPVMDGFQMLEELRRKSIEDESKIVILTSSSNPKDLEQAKKFNIYAYVNKPLTVDKMKQIVDTL